MPTESINLDDLDYEDTESSTEEESAIIRCGRILSRKAKETNADKLLSANNSEIIEIDDITDVQKAYLNSMAIGNNNEDTCLLLGIDKFLPVLWRENGDKDGTYCQCLNLLKTEQADALEEVVWKEAIRNPKSVILKMFALKARKDEYKDNALPMTAVQTNIHVSLCDQFGNKTPFIVNVDANVTEEDINGKQ